MAALSTINLKSFKGTYFLPILVASVKLLLVLLLSIVVNDKALICIFVRLFIINARITSRRQENRIFLLFIEYFGRLDTVGS